MSSQTIETCVPVDISDSDIYEAMKDIPGGPVMVDDYKVALPPKQAVYGSIEGLMAHFKHIMHGMQPPVGEVYGLTEAEIAIVEGAKTS